MDKLTKFACYLRRNRGETERQSVSTTTSNAAAENLDFLDENTDESARYLSLLKGLLLWDHPSTILRVFLYFILPSILYWGGTTLRGIAPVITVAVFVTLFYHLRVEHRDCSIKNLLSQQDLNIIERVVQRATITLQKVKLLRKNRPELFFAAVLLLSLDLWLIGRSFNDVPFMFIMWLAIVHALVSMQVVSCETIWPRYTFRQYAAQWKSEMETEMEEFLPNVTDDNLEVLQRAGDAGETSQITPSHALPETPIDPLNEDELAGLKMPSHEEGSIDDLDGSELELSSAEIDETEDIKMRSEHFEPGSSSEDDADLEAISTKLPSASDESDSEFEIIDSREIAHLEDL